MEWIAIGLSTLVTLGVTIWIKVASSTHSKLDAQITDLYNKHEADASKLNDLALKVANDHYSKAEIKELLKEFKEYLDEKFTSIAQALAHR